MADFGTNRQGESSSPRAASWYHVVLGAIGDAVMATDPDGYITYMNPVAESLTGWSHVEAHGEQLERVFSIINEGTRKPGEQPVRRVIETGLIRGLANHTLLIQKDGTEIPIDDSAAPVWGEGGVLVGVVMIFRDITERRQAEHLIELAKEYAESIVTSVREPLIVLNADLHVRSANRAFYQTFRVDQAETEGRFIYDLGDGQWNIPALKTLLEEIIPRNSAFDDFEVEHDFPGVGQRTMLLNARRFPPEGKWELILLAFADITDRKLIDRDRARLLRDAEAARDSSEAAGVKLTDADRQKNQFLAMLAHELRNPLAAVRNAVEVAARSGSKEDLEWSRDVTSRQIRNFAHLINDLLDVARVTEGKIQLRKQIIDAAPVVGHAVAAVQPLIDERKHELVVSFSSPDSRLEADTTRLEQILVNLLANAAKYTPSGGRIELNVGVEGGEMVFRVRDNGVGILPSLLPRIFDLFTQADRSLDRSEGGLGIGLTLVKSLAELHGGTVTATSAGPGKGSEFIVRLPAAERLAGLEAEPRKDVAALSPRSIRVLVVDDNKDTARGMARLLKLSGHDVRAAYDAEEALAIAREFRPEAMLLDIGLPGMDGYDLATAFRSEVWAKDSVLIAVSGYGEDQARDRSKEAGFNHHMVKPVNFETILGLIGGS